MALKVLFTSTPDAGHVNPLIRYALGLKEAGHEVRFASREAAKATVEKHGFGLARLDDPSEEEYKRAWALLDASRGRDGLAVGVREMFGRAMARAALPGVVSEIERWRPNLVVHESGEFAGLVAAEMAGVRTACVSVLASGVMAEYEAEYRGTVEDLRQYAGLTGAGPEPMSMVLTACPSGVDKVRRILGVEPIRIGQSGAPTSPVDGDEAWLPAEGERLVYVTFGTVAGRSDKSKAAYRRALAVVADLPIRVLLTTGPVMDPALLSPVPDNVRVETFVPQAKVFSRADAIVHHGGSGTFIGALAAGLPQVVVPLFADQPYNARDVSAAGAGIAVEDTDPETLRAAILRALDAPEIRARAGDIAREMAAMPGVPHAVAALEAHAR